MCRLMSTGILEPHPDYKSLPLLVIDTSGNYNNQLVSMLAPPRAAKRGRRPMTTFHRQVEEQIPRLRRYARALTRNPERADDLVQDTLVRALAKQHLWQPDTNLRAWLFTLMHNQNVNNVRQSIREGL